MKNYLSIQFKRNIKRYLACIYSFFKAPNKNAIFIIGNQKSGTSAIASLLSWYGGLSLTLDIVNITTLELESLVKNKLPMKRFIQRHAWEFSRDIIKEPWLTLFYNELQKVYSHNYFLFIIRDPRDNIRSILNRLNIPGDLLGFPHSSDVSPLWQKIVDNRWLGITDEDYIQSLAARWVHFANIYLKNSDKLILAKYEDFLDNKVAYIEKLAHRLKIAKKNDISDRVDIQFQPRGQREIGWEEFFGERNLKLIEKKCINQMLNFGYKPIFN